MKILITGCNGFIGKKLYSRLDYLGFKVAGFDLPCDITKLELNPWQDHHDVVIHCAALTSVTESGRNRKKYSDVNVGGTINMLQVFRGSRFIFLSTSAVYGEGSMHTEDGPTDPKSIYAATKLQAEKCVEYMAIDYAILRLANVIGEGSKDNVYNRFASEDPITVYGDGEQTRDFINVEDVCTAIIRAIDYKIQGTYNIGSGKLTRIIDLARTFNKRIVYAPERPGEIKHISMDLTKASREGLINKY